MEAQEEFIGSNDHTNQIVKRKRTKRQRFSSPIGVTAVTSSTSSGGGSGAVVEDYGSITSPTTSSYIYESTEEEEEMANCLIMLAQGDFLQKQAVKGNQIRKEKFRARKFAEVAGVTTTSNKAGFYVYECKTCNRTFPSFQALGGHRASHKKPKPMVMVMVMEEEKESPMALPIVQEIDEESQFNKITPTGLSIRTPNKGKIHECSICGSEFTSGQALGGHMRRHRANTNNHQAVGASLDTSNNTIDDPIEVQERARNFLSLDLNLPASEDDDHHHSSIESKFKFATSTQQPLLFSAPALVDCHY